ncbi:SHOCT domain-containing protein [Microbacterium sp. G2-8]|uniref:SHOCT domain-containing protein n=1 Tax=Microbacterium sp. G2-8 TaxID=2842454 RepID=UPI001C8A7FDF|nr:SHOCT domain-containing protein [Microbacterium sp. G2-8]
MDLWENFWDLIWWFIWVFAFIAYLFAIFAIIGDLFRDRKLNGWWKALWIVLLVFVPFLTALAYVIARGKGMAERQATDARAAQQAAEDYIRDAAGTAASPATEIAKAKDLLDAGTIDQREYEALKAKAIALS